MIVLGPTLNLASRLEAFAEEDEIITSKTLKNMVQDGYDFVPIETEFRTGGKSNEGIKAFEKEKIVYSLKGKK